MKHFYKRMVKMSHESQRNELLRLHRRAIDCAKLANMARCPTLAKMYLTTAKMISHKIREVLWETKLDSLRQAV